MRELCELVRASGVMAVKLAALLMKAGAERVVARVEAEQQRQAEQDFDRHVAETLAVVESETDRTFREFGTFADIVLTERSMGWTA